MRKGKERVEGLMPELLSGCEHRTTQFAARVKRAKARSRGMGKVNLGKQGQERITE